MHQTCKRKTQHRLIHTCILNIYISFINRRHASDTSTEDIKQAYQQTCMACTYPERLSGMTDDVHPCACFRVALFLRPPPQRFMRQLSVVGCRRQGSCSGAILVQMGGTWPSLNIKTRNLNSQIRILLTRMSDNSNGE